MNYNCIDFEASFGTFSQLTVSDLPEICFSGRSNVGKSSLINKILNRKNLARVSTKPGKTVTINFYKGDKARFVDLPGYGYAKTEYSERERWAELMEGYFKSKRNIAVVFQLIDMRHKVSDFDISMLDFLCQMDILYVIVLTKSDKLNKTEYAMRLASVKEELGELAQGVDIIPASALKGDGIVKISEKIDEILNVYEEV